MDQEKRIDYIWIDGLNLCLRFRLPKFKGIIPCKEIKRIVADEDNENVRVIFGNGENEKTLVMQGSLDAFISTLNAATERRYTEENNECRSAF